MMDKSTKVREVYERLLLTSVFRGVLTKPLFALFFKYVNEKGDAKLSLYSELVGEIYESGMSLTALVAKYVFENENIYIKSRANGEKVSNNISRAVNFELDTFKLFASLAKEDFMLDMGIDGEYIPGFDTQEADFVCEYENRIKDISKYGYGIFSEYPMFRVGDSGEIEPIVSYDKVSVDKFVGYKQQRDKVIENTEAFLSGRPCANVLLYGDAGTGKSSTVKAVVNLFYSEGLRLIEMRKDQLRLLPSVMGRISNNPLRFIIFIDDLSFNQNDDNFSMLKAALEGSASSVSENSVIYATSNRRHIVKENFSDREGNDVHRNDTIQETLSLSERFGLTVLFQKPDKALYLEIIDELLQRYGIEKTEKIHIDAEAFALRRGYRSARCAEQFIKSLL